MRITIDTKEDSRDEIKRTIHFLSSLLGENVAVNADTKDIFEEEGPAQSEGSALTSLFGNDSSDSTTILPDNPDEEETDGKDEEAASQVQFIY